MIRFNEKDINTCMMLLDATEVHGIENMKRVLLIAQILQGGEKEAANGSHKEGRSK